MDPAPKMTPEDLWKYFVEAYKSYGPARIAVMRLGPQLVPLLAKGMFDPDSRAAALDVCERLPTNVRLLLLENLVELAVFSHGQTAAARAQIISLPRDTVLKELAAIVPRILSRNDYEEYAGVIALCVSLDARAMADEVARRAAESADPDVREMGERYANGDTFLW
jgi:hypothetical protein